MSNTPASKGILAAVEAVKALVELRRVENAGLSSSTLKAIAVTEAHLNRDIETFFGLSTQPSADRTPKTVGTPTLV